MLSRRSIQWYPMSVIATTKSRSVVSRSQDHDSIRSRDFAMNICFYYNTHYAYNIYLISLKYTQKEVFSRVFDTFRKP